MFKNVIVALVLCLPLAAAAEEAGPAAILADLMDGNARYVRGDRGELPRIDGVRRAELVGEQHPKAIVLSCADSRVPPEHVFRQGLGDLFVARVAGNVPMTGMIASIEYAVEHLHTPVLMVMGHSSCGAVKATIGQAAPDAHSITPALDALVEEIMPAVVEAEEIVAHDGGDLVATAVEVNAKLAARNLLARSEVVRHAVSIGELRIVVAEYDLATGVVEIVEADVQPDAHH